MVPKGKLLIIGGAEDRNGNEMPEEIDNDRHHRFEILKLLLSDNRKDGRIEVITSASRQPEQLQKIYEKTFEEIGYKNFGFLTIENKRQARGEDIEDRVRKASVIFFTGGDQLRLSTIVPGTKIAHIIKKKYMEEKGFTVAGTSAGAMFMSTTMISGGGITEALLGSDIHMSSGLGLIKDCIVDTHFIKRGRFNRLGHAVILNPGNLGIGLGENTALMIEDGNNAECIGSGMVVLIDGSAIERTNISEAEAGEPVYVENLKVHLLVQHCQFNLESHVMEVPDESSKR